MASYLRTRIAGSPGSAQWIDGRCGGALHARQQTNPLSTRRPRVVDAFPHWNSGLYARRNPHGRSLAFVQPAANLNLWLYDARNCNSPRLLAPSTQAEYSPAFSPDGQKIAFVSDRSGAADIWLFPVKGGEPRKLTSLQPGEIPMWPSCYETDLASGSTGPLRAGDDYALFPQYSADGKSLYYVSNAGHRFRIWRQPLGPSSDAEPLGRR